MNRFLISYFIVLLIVYASSCTSRNFNDEDRPSSRPQDDAELADASMRISGDILSMSYDDGGVLFSRSVDGVIKVVRVDDGTSFEYNPKTVQLKINDATIALSSGEIIKRSGSIEWHKLTLSNSISPIYIVVDL